MLTLGNALKPSALDFLKLSAIGLLIYQMIIRPKRKQSAEPLPVRNNNPFALIQFKPSKWRGLSKNTGPFLSFVDEQSGVRAGFINLIQTYLKRGLTTPAQILPKYAPAIVGNNPDAYIKSISQIAGIGPNETIFERSKLYQFGRAIEKVESGKNWVTKENWDAGFRQALEYFEGKI